MQGSGNKEQGTGNSMAVLRNFAAFGGLSAALLLAGCRQDMHNQPKIFPQRGTTVFADGRSSRPQVENTVARSQAEEGSYFATGVEGGKEGDGLPIDLTPALMERGQERYNVFCTPCHSRVGNGLGMIVQRGYRPAGNFHTDRLRNAPLGHFYSVIANGYGSMPEYGSQIMPEDRWAIVAYVRALQLSQAAKSGDVASGQHVQDLHAIAEGEGMPPGFAEPWSLPSTAVYGTLNGQDNGIPGQGINTPPTGAMAHGSQAATQNSGQRNSGGAPQAGTGDNSGSTIGGQPIGGAPGR